MKLDFNSFPLNIYNEVKAQSLLESVNFEMAKSRSGRFDAVQFIGSSVVKKLCGGSFAFLLENLSMWYNEAKARRCLSKLIDEQVNRVKCDSSALLEMAQANLMISYCVTDYLNGLVSSSCGNAVKSCGKVIAGLFKRKDPRDVIWNSILVETKKWYDICQCYHIAFLLNVYNSIPDSEAEIRSLITESFRSNICEENVPLFSSKERPILFSNIQYKSLSENLEKRIGVLAAGITKELYDDLYEPFIKECIKYTETAGALVNVVETAVDGRENK